MKVICAFLIELFLCYVQSDKIANQAIFGLRSDRRNRSSCEVSEHNETYSACGKNIKLEESTAFIFTDDEETGPGSWPWLVSIGDMKSWERSNKWSHRCGGSLITSQLVLTAAHCCIADLIIRAGDGHLKSDSDDDGVQVVAVDSYTKHPNFNRLRRYFDIGILKLSCEVAFTRYVRPICAPKLSTRSRDNDIHLVVAGWGTNNKDQAGKNIIEASFQVYPKEYCDDKYLGQRRNEKAVPFGFTDDLLCGGDAAGSEGVCEGDSGSPAVFYNPIENRYTIKGVVSGGLSCGTKNHPNIYVRIGNPQIHQWIVRQIKKATEKKVDGAWSAWSSWTGCTSTCGTATKTRERTCSNPAPTNGGKPCRGPKEQIDECSLSPCGIAQCSVPETCEKRENCEPVQRKYSALRQATTKILRRKLVDELKSLVCNKKEKAFCCPPSVLDIRVGSSWSSWESWSTCTKPCGAGNRTRRRHCSGTECSRSQQDQTRFCNTHKC